MEFRGLWEVMGYEGADCRLNQIPSYNVSERCYKLGRTQFGPTLLFAFSSKEDSMISSLSQCEGVLPANSEMLTVSFKARGVRVNPYPYQARFVA